MSDPIVNAETQPGRWTDGSLPANVVLGPGTVLAGSHIFRQFRSHVEPALVIGAHCTMEGVHFAIGKNARVFIGDYCAFSNGMLLCEQEIRIGSYVVIGWNVAIADTDYHPIAPAERIADAIACSPVGQGRPRPQVICRPVVLGNDVWIGPNATILKGVHIGDGAFIEPGTMVTHDVPARARVLGNPAQIVGEM